MEILPSLPTNLLKNQSTVIVNAMNELLGSNHIHDLTIKQNVFYSTLTSSMAIFHLSNAFANLS